MPQGPAHHCSPSCPAHLHHRHHHHGNQASQSEPSLFRGTLKLSLLYPDTPHPTPRGLQGPLLLEKPSQLPPTFLQGRQGESPSGEAQEPGAGVQSPSLEPQSPAWPRHDAEARQEPLRDSSGHLGNTVSHDSSVLSSLQHSSLERCTDISRLSSGYAGDEENSEVSMPGSHRIVRLSRRLHTQAGGAQTNQVCAVHSPKQLKRRLARQANSTNQTGGE